MMEMDMTTAVREKFSSQAAPDVLAALRATAPLIARMSGSGATCFALYDTPEARDAAKAAMPREWWTMAGRLR